MKLKYSVFLLFTAAGIALISTACASSAHISITDKPVHTLTAEFVPDPILEQALKNFADPDNTAQSVFDTKELHKTFAASGITLKKIQLIGAAGLKFSCTIPEQHPIFAQFIQHNRAEKSLRITVSPQTVNAVLMLLPEESKGFIDFLAAPIFTGEDMTADEYGQTITVLYGTKLGTALKQAFFILSIDIPYTVEKAEVSPIGTVVQKKHRQCRIQLPLIELLCAKTPITVTLQGK